MKHIDEINKLIQDYNAAPEDTIAWLRATRKITERYRSLIPHKIGRKFLSSIPFPHMMEILRTATPTSSSSALQQYYMEKMKLAKTDDKDKGDFKNLITNRYIEFKITIITISNNSANFVQVRPWQGTDSLFVIIDMEAEQIKEYIYYLTHEQMTEEMSYAKVTNAHGTKKANEHNPNPEKAIRFKVGNDTFNRWEKYLINNEMLLLPNIPSVEDIQPEPII